MDSSVDELGPTEGTVSALLDFLVDPLLPARTSSRESISPSQEQLVAKQVHAVVFLYNYYHRKQNPSLPFLEFQPFCKLARVLKPSLQLYFSLMERSDYEEKDDPDKHLSLTEKAVINACETAKSLDGSDNQTIEGWPVSKVAVFLVDFRKENCYLFHGSITQGVWSAIEKEVDVSGQGSEAANKKKRVIKKASNQTADGTGLLQLAYLAVKETCGINHYDLKHLENHLVYSTSEPKTAVRLYIMQCMQTNFNPSVVPINEVLESLQGPLIKKESINWIFTPVVEYFHLLPYADKVSEWLKSDREKSSNTSQQFEAVQEVGNRNSFHVRAEQPSDSSYHLKAVNEIEIGARPKSNELSNVSEQNRTVFHAKEEPFLSTSKQNCINHRIGENPIVRSFETFRSSQARHGNGCHLKDDFAAFAPKRTEAPKAKNVSSSPLEDTHPGTLQHSVAVKEASEVAKEVKIGDSCYSKKESLPNPPLIVGALEAIRKNEEPRPGIPQDTESDREVKNNGNYSRKVDRTVVYRKRNRSQKTNSCSKNPVLKASVAPRQEEEQGKELMKVAPKTDQTTLTGGALVVADVPVASSKEPNAKEVLLDNKISDPVMPDHDENQDRPLASLHPNDRHRHKIQTIDSKENLISQTALKILYKKREQLSLQQRSIEDEIALCDRRIETILSGGSENDLAVKLDSILEGCNDLCLRTAAADENKTGQHIQDRGSSPILKRKRLSEANLCAQSPCQELDRICNENVWFLPTYSLSTLKGGFQASVTVKGVDSNCSSDGSICATPCAARNSAASRVLARLWNMAA